MPVRALRTVREMDSRSEWYYETDNNTTGCRHHNGSSVTWVITNRRSFGQCIIMKHITGISDCGAGVVEEGSNAYISGFCNKQCFWNGTNNVTSITIAGFNPNMVGEGSKFILFSRG